MPEIKYRGKLFEELAKMDVNELSKLLTSRQRRSIKRGLLEQHRELMLKIRKAKEGKYKKPIKTHSRDMIVLPEMVGLQIHIYNGREFRMVPVTEDMIGMFFGELVLTRSKVEHSAPGIGATKSSTAIASKAK